MNFEQLLAGAVRHRKTKDARRHRFDMERDASNNAQRFANQRNLQQQSHDAQMMRQQQQQHFQQQQKRQQEDAEAAKIDSDINAVRDKRRRNEITAEEERTLLWGLENKKRGLQTAGGPPPETPWYVGTDKDLGKKWWEDTDDDKPGGGKWRVQYGMTNRGEQKVLRDERKEWEERDNARREQDRLDREEERAKIKDERESAAEQRREANEQRNQSREDRAQDTAERAEDRADREEQSANRSQESHQATLKAKEDDALYTKLERRAERSADAELASEWTRVTQSQEWIDAGNETTTKKKQAAREAVANQNGFDVNGEPTTSKRKQKVNEILDRELKDEENKAGHLASTEQAVPYNADAGMYEVVV